MDYMILYMMTQTASTYNCGAYGVGDYNANEACLTTEDGSAQPPTGQLSETGMAVVTGIVGGILLIVVAIAVLVTTRRKRSKK